MGFGKQPVDGRPKKSGVELSLFAGKVFYFGSAVAAIIITLASGFSLKHDYLAYFIQWKITGFGGDPWSTSYEGKELLRNAYGPLHVLFYKFLVFGDVVPKLVLTIITLLTPALLLLAVHLDNRRDRQDRRLPIISSVILLVCMPLTVITVFVFGINDGVVGFLLLLACILRSRGWFGAVGIALGLAALLKFYPLLFAPFFAITVGSGVFRIRTVLATAATFAFGMYLGYIQWGSSVFSPFLYGSDRDPKHLSILKYLEYINDELSIAPFVDFLINGNSYFVLGIAVLVSLWGWVTRQGWEVTALLGILAIFMTYKVGHPQFYVSWMAVLSWILLASHNKRAITVARAFLPVAVFLSLYQLLFLASWIFTGKYFSGDWIWFRIYGSVVFLAFVVVSLIRCRKAINAISGPPLTIRF